MTILKVKNLNLSYGKNSVVHDLNLEIDAEQVYAIIGPSGCGKSSFLRSINRMNDFVDGFSLQGLVEFNGDDIYSPGFDACQTQAKRWNGFSKT